jgi:hypothetical protein
MYNNTISFLTEIGCTLPSEAKSKENSSIHKTYGRGLVASRDALCISDLGIVPHYREGYTGLTEI